MSPGRAATIAAALTSAPLALLVWSMTEGSIDYNRIEQFIFGFAILATPLVTAAVVVVYRSVATARGRDLPERLLSLATAGLRGSRGDWGAAMRAELASVDDSRERRRFAVGCSVTALRSSTGGVPLFVAIAMGALFAVGTLAASRATLAGGRGGIMGFTLFLPAVVLFTTSFVMALGTRSFRTGLVSGLLALTTGLIGFFAVAMAEAARWYEVAGVHLMDGDYPKGGGLERLDAILDPVSPAFVLLHLLIWAPSPVLGAVLGSLFRGRAQHEAPIPQ
jgi:hypothetical protein